MEKTPTVSFFSLLMQLVEEAVLPQGVFVQRGLGVPTPSLPEVSSAAAMQPGLAVPPSLCHGAGGCKGAKSLSRSGWLGTAEQELLWCRSLPRDRQFNYSRLAIFFQTHYFFMDSLFFFPRFALFSALPVFPAWHETSSLSYNGAGLAPITSPCSIIALTFTGDRLRANYTP